MASLKYEANSSLQSVTLGSSYTAASGTMSLTAGHGARLPSTGDFWLAYDDNTGIVRIFKVTARSTDTLTVVADATEGSGDANLASGVTLRWALTVSALTQLRVDIAAQSGLVLLKSLTASASASLDFTTRTDGSAIIQSDFDEYRIEFIQIVPATDSTSLRMRVSTDGGATYVSTASYSHWIWLWSSGGGGAAGLTGQTAIDLNYNDTLDSSSNWGASGFINLFNPGGSAFKLVTGQLVVLDGAGTRATFLPSGAYEAATAVNAFQFYMSSGNIASGIIRVYGIAKS